jgi:NADH:ubiquinone oxidoreductase subunit E
VESIGESLARNPALREEFGPEKLAQVAAIIASHRAKPGSLIPVLEEVQETLGYIPPPIQEKVALGMGLSLSEVHGVVTFYHYFTTVPRGRHTIRCCLWTACYVRGSKNNLLKLSDILGVAPGDTTADRRFSLETVRCLGACGLAPVMTVDEDTFRQVKPTKIKDTLEHYE